MKDHVNAEAAFKGSTVVSTRKESAIEGTIVRRRKLADGTRITTYEVSEDKAELLLALPGGLVRRNTALNPDNIKRACELVSTMSRKEAEAALGVSSGTFRRLLQAGGADVRVYQSVLTPENITKALQVTVKYNVAKRGDIIKASKEMGVDSRTMRRLLQRGLETMTLEQISAIRTEEAKRLSTPEGQKEVEASRAPLPRKAKPVVVLAPAAPAAPEPAADTPASDAPVSPAMQATPGEQVDLLAAVLAS